MALNLSTNRVKRKFTLATMTLAVFALVAQPLVALNIPQAFAAAGEPEVTHVDAYFLADPTYTAIGVDFKTINVTDAADIELRVNRAGGGTYSIFATPSLVAAINAQASPTSTSGPIVIAGSRTSGSWTNQTGTWTGSALPESVDVIVTFADKAPVSLRDDTISANKAAWDQVKPNEAPKITIATPTVGGLVGTKANGNKLKITGKFTDDEQANYMGVQLIKDGVSRADGIVYGYGTPGSAPNYADVNGNFTLNMDVPAGLETGSYMLRFVGTDHNVYSQHTMVERNFVIDNTPPTGAITTPIAGSIVGVANGKLVVSGTVAENLSMNRIGVQLVKRGVSGHVQYIYANNNGLYGTNPTTWNAEFKNLDLEDGAEYGINLYIVDQVGNVTNNNTHWFTVDSAAPAQPTGLHYRAVADAQDYSDNDLHIKRQAIYPKWEAVTKDVDGGSEDVDYYNYQSKGGYTTKIYGTDASADSTIKNWVPPTDVADGFKVQAVDKAGNVGQWSDWMTMTFDSTAPKVSGVEITPMTTGKVVGGQVKVSFTMIDASEIDTRKDYTYVQFMDGKDSNGATVSSGTYAVQRDGISDRYFAMVNTKDFVPEGTTADKFSVYIRTKDKVGAGNQDEQTFFVNQIAVDNKAPGQPLVTPDATKTRAVGSAFEITVKPATTDGGNISEVTINDVEQTLSGDGKYTIDTTGMNKGAKVTVVAVATDAAGNTATTTTEYTVDNGTPAVLEGVLTSDDMGLFSLNGTSGFGPGATVTVTNLANNATFVGVTNADGSWNVFIGELLADTTYSFSVVIANSLGYVSTPLLVEYYIPAVDTEGSALSLQPTSTAPNLIIAAADAAGGLAQPPAVSDEAVAGARDVAKTGDTAVLAASDQGWKLYGTAWYWWLLVVAALAGAWWFFAGLRRRRQAEETL